MSFAITNLCKNKNFQNSEDFERLQIATAFLDLSAIVVVTVIAITIICKNAGLGPFFPGIGNISNQAAFAMLSFSGGVCFADVGCVLSSVCLKKKQSIDTQKKENTEPAPSITKEPETQIHRTNDDNTTPEQAEAPTIEKSVISTELIEELKEAIKYQDIERIVKIANQFPQDRAEELFDLIFEQAKIFSMRGDIWDFTKKIHEKTPFEVLPPFHTLLKEIYEDRQSTMTCEILLERLKSLNLHEDHEKIATCYRFAHRCKHTSLYHAAETPVPVQDYTLNFLWINRDPQSIVNPEAQHIFGDGKDPSKLDCESEGNFMNQIAKWADLHPGAQMNIWFDKALVTEMAYENTKRVVQQIAESKNVTLTLRNIREIVIDPELACLLHPVANVYFRVDLVKALISDYFMKPESGTTKYCVVSDIDIEPMEVKQLFDRYTLSYLSSHGYVLNGKSSTGNYENSFLIFNQKKEGLQVKHETCLLSNLKQRELLDPERLFHNYARLTLSVEKDEDDRARKAVKCPSSQFAKKNDFKLKDFRRETFQVNADLSLSPKNGRFHKKSDPKLAEALQQWHIP